MTKIAKQCHTRILPTVWSSVLSFNYVDPYFLKGHTVPSSFGSIEHNIKSRDGILADNLEIRVLVSCRSQIIDSLI